jgi:hypothetical protein
MVEKLTVWAGGLMDPAELADGFQLKVNFSLGGFDVKTRAGCKIAAMTGWSAGAAAFVQMIQINLVVDAPGQIVQFQNAAGKPGVSVFSVENLLIVESGGGGSRKTIYRRATAFS